MANIMQQKNVRNHVHRNGFDLSRKNAFTAKVGELLPCFVMETIPGDHIDIDVTGFTRTSPVDTAAYTRVKEYVDFYYVPYHLLWDKFNAWVIQTGNPTYAQSSLENAGAFSTSPYITDRDLLFYLSSLVHVEQDSTKPTGAPWNLGLDVCGLNRRQQTLKLLDLLGYGYITNSFLEVSEGNTITGDDMPESISSPTALNFWRILAYQKIYQDFYRDSQWESAKPWTYNLDYVLKENQLHYDLNDLISSVKGNSTSSVAAYNSPFDLRYCNWKKDYIMGLQPSQQFGDVAFAGPVLGDLGVDLSGNSSVASYDVSIQNLLGVFGINAPYRANGVLRTQSLGNTSGISVFAIRQAEALQKWKEIAQSGSLDFKEQLKKHWNVDVSDEASDMCRWLGGDSNMIDISEVVNTSLNGIEDSADIKGRGTGSHRGHIKFDAKHYGVVIGIYHAVPYLDYQSSISMDRQLTKVVATDFAIPEMDSIGMQEVFGFENIYPGFVPSSVDGSPIPRDLNKLVMGYAPRYIEYKTAIDKVFGGFAHGGYKQWVAPVDFDYLNFMQVRAGQNSDVNIPQKTLYSYVTKKVSPYLLNPIFLAQVDNKFDGTFSNDQLLCNYYFDAKVVRNLSETGLPY